MASQDPKALLSEFETFRKKDTPTASNPHWLPLESNPDVLNQFVHRTGLPLDWQWCDVFGLDPELLAMVPQPCVAVCLLYPSKNISRPRRAEMSAAVQEGRTGPFAPDLFYLWQIEAFGNACGSIAAVHAVATSYLQGVVPLEDGPLRAFIDSCRGESPGVIGTRLADCTALHEVSEESADSGATATPDREDDTDNHFIAFIHHGGTLYELDGCMGFPVNHGPSSAATLLADAVKVIREQFIARDPNNPNFSLLALCKVE
eukprot:EG_transcript_17524